MFSEAEDYLELACPLRRPGAHRAVRKNAEKIPVADVIAECDRLFNSEAVPAVGEHLRKWLDKAAELGEAEAELTISSELMGHYRMTGDSERGLEIIKKFAHQFQLFKTAQITGVNRIKSEFFALPMFSNRRNITSKIAESKFFEHRMR